MESIAKTSALILELLVGGILVSFSIGLLIFSISPAEVQLMLARFNQLQSIPGKEAFFAAIFTATVYGIGLISESCEMAIFERWLDQIKRDRLKKFIERNRSIFKDDEVLCGYAALLDNNESEEFNKKIKADGPSSIREMRFYVLMKSPPLYGEIESQIGRGRLIRILLFAEVILFIAISVFLFRKYSSASIAILGVIIFLGFATVMAVKFRFERYCRSIERGYKAIKLDPNLKQAAAKAGA